MEFGEQIADQTITTDSSNFFTMKLLRFLFFFFIICFEISLAQLNGTSPLEGQEQLAEDRKEGTVDPNEVDIDALLDAFGVPSCIEHCLDGLKSTMAQMFRLNGTFDVFQQICQDFRTTRKCVHSSGCFGSHLFDTVTSGLQSLCEDRKQHFINKNEACLRRTLDGTSRQCEAKCHLIQALADFSHRPDLKGLGITHMLELLEHLGGVCSAADCFLPCYRDGLNSACPKAGGVILDGFLRPFFQLANFIQKGGIRRLVDEKVPKECHFLTEKDSLEKIVNPNKF